MRENDVDSLALQNLLPFRFLLAQLTLSILSNLIPPIVAIRHLGHSELICGGLEARKLLQQIIPSLLILDNTCYFSHHLSLC